MRGSDGHPTHERLLPFQGLHDIDGLCHIRVYERPGRMPVVIAGELEDNPGTKISHGIEMVAQAIRREFFPEGREFVLIEHHPQLFDERQPTFQLVHLCHASDEEPSGNRGASAGIAVLDDGRFGKAAHGRRLQGDVRDPSWSRIPDVTELTGCPVAAWPKGRYTARAVGGPRGDYLRRQVAARGRAAADRLMANLAER